MNHAHVDKYCQIRESVFKDIGLDRQIVTWAIVAIDEHGEVHSGMNGPTKTQDRAALIIHLERFIHSLGQAAKSQEVLPLTTEAL